MPPPMATGWPFPRPVGRPGTPFLGLVVILALLVLGATRPARADLTLPGPSGFITVPSHTTIKPGQVEFAAHGRRFFIPGTKSSRYLTNLAFGFSPFRDFEIGVQKAIDSRRGTSDQDPDATVNVKVRLPSMGAGEFSESAFGLVVDTNPNNYHTLYFTLGGFGLGWNFGGNPGAGTAQFGSYDRGRKKPRDLCLLIGTEYPPPQPGERGYRSHYLIDYNGDVFSLGWRLKSHRGFWVDAAVQSKSTYTDFYDFLPLTLGFGAIF